MLHPESKLHHLPPQIDWGYDDSVRFCTNVEDLERDGTRSGRRHGHAYRIPPDHPDLPALARLHRAALEAHHAALGLAPPTEADLPWYLRRDARRVSPDAAPTDAGPTDAAPTDAGPTDAGP